MASEGLPGGWREAWPGVEVVEEGGRTSYVRHGELLVTADRAHDAARLVPAARRDRERPCPASHTRLLLDTDGAGIMAAVETLRAAGMAAAPNHVLGGVPAVTYAGAPRMQGGPSARVRPAPPVPDAPPLGAGDGAGAHVAVLDTGIRSDNPWLAAYVPSDPSSPDWEQLDADGDRVLDAEAGHGTFIAGIVLQIAPAASLTVIKVLDSHGMGDDATVAAGLERLPDGVDVLNLSLGGYTVGDEPPPALAGQVARLRRNGTVVVAAAGNDATDRPFWPAALRPVIAVGALDADGARAGYSNHGPWIDVYARGSELHSCFVDFTTEVRPEGGTATFAGWALWDGTSFAAPVVSAAVAVLMAARACPAQAALQVLADECGGPSPQGCAPAPALDLERLAAIKSVPLPAGLR